MFVFLSVQGNDPLITLTDGSFEFDNGRRVMFPAVSRCISNKFVSVAQLFDLTYNNYYCMTVYPVQRNYRPARRGCIIGIGM